MDNPTPGNPATFNPIDADHWLTLITGFAQLAVMLAPLIAQIIAASQTPKS